LNPSLQALVEQYGEGSEPVAAALAQPGAQHAQA
jgi:hypothetical protein